MVTKLNIKELNELCEKGYLIKNHHPTKPLIIWNYSRTTQFEKNWTPVTLACRGLVTDGNGNIVARPLPKFFNDFEYKEGEIPYHLKHETFIKEDGSLGIGFLYEGEVIIASRGSFASEQSQKAMEIFQRDHCYPNYIWSDYTYAFEIIYPSNRIVVDYGKVEKLVLLAMFNTKTGQEVPYEVMHWYNHDRFNIVKKVELNVPITEYRSTIQGADEGYIVRFENGFRMKIKGEEYCRLHRILTHVSNKSIWQSLKDEKPLEEILQKIPDEYDEWVNQTISKFNQDFDGIKNIYLSVLKMFNHLEGREFALSIMDYCKKRKLNWGILFAMKNGKEKEWKGIIWESLYLVYEKASKTVHELKIAS